MALDKAQDYVAAARTLLQDTVEVYRYSDEHLISMLNFGLLTARRIRPDLFLGLDSVPEYTDLTDDVDMDEQYRLALLYFIVGHVQLSDDEDTQDQRAVGFINKFTSQMLVVQS